MLAAVSVFLGTIIGAGIFGLPFVAMKAGFFPVLFYIIVICFLAIKIHLLYADVALATDKKFRLPGYVGEYMGSLWKTIAFLITATGFICALIAYLAIGGNFLSNIINVNPLLSAFFIFLIGSFIIFKDIRMISKAEFLLVVFLFIIIAYLFLKSFPFIIYKNLLSFDSAFIALPYGVALFSLWGLSIIPELKEMLGKRNLKNAIIAGLAVSAIVYIIFVFFVLGVCGINTSEDAISGLRSLGSRIVWFGSLFGFICCFTSYITIGLTFKKSLEKDFNASKIISLLVSCFIPFIIFLLGLRSFIKIIGFAGAVAMGLEGIMVILLYRACFNKKYLKISDIAVISALIIGVIVELWNFF